MNEEIEYAEMLEIPVSTVSVVKKKRTRKRKEETPAPAPLASASTEARDLKESLIEKVNDKRFDTPDDLSMDAHEFAESVNSDGNIDFGEFPERVDTVRLYDDDGLDGALYPREIPLGEWQDREEPRAKKAVRILLGAEFAVACALCGAIFLTNVFMPTSAINTFFRALESGKSTAQRDSRTYADFTLSSVVNDYADTELNLSPTGVLSFTDACCVYPAADGKVGEITQNADGSYLVKITHSDSFSGVISGLSTVYYAVGDEVKARVPVGYTDGETQVQVTMYSSGQLLSCFEVTDENCLAWVSEE